MIDDLSGAFGALVVGWLLLGPAILMALSQRVRGATKLFWVAGALAPIFLAILGVLIAVQVYPESPLHIHSNHIPAASFFCVVGVWAVYIAFRRRYVPTQP